MNAVNAMREEQAEQVIADRDWWREFGEQFGWRLRGWTYRYYASFWISDAERERIEINALAKSQIERAISMAGLAATKYACSAIEAGLKKSP